MADKTILSERKFKNIPHLPFSPRPSSQTPKITQLKKKKERNHTNSRCYFLSWHTFPFIYSRDVGGNSTTLIELPFQQPRGRGGLGCLQKPGPALKSPSHAQGWASGRHWALLENHWKISGSEKIKVVSDRRARAEHGSPGRLLPES